VGWHVLAHALWSWLTWLHAPAVERGLSVFSIGWAGKAVVHGTHAPKHQWAKAVDHARAGRALVERKRSQMTIGEIGVRSAADARAHSHGSRELLGIGAR
jgi:hypothetical protein